MNYWFYLESYSFLFRNEYEAVIYNTLNGAYLRCPNHAVVNQILDSWENSANGYGARLNIENLKDETVQNFIDLVRDSFSGDLIPLENIDLHPYHFKPTLFINSNLRIKKEDKIESIGERVMQNLHEVTLHLANKCSKNCDYCSYSYLQTNHCTQFNTETLTLEDYVGLLKQCQKIGVRKTNIILGGNPMDNETCTSLLSIFKDSCLKRHLYINYSFLNEETAKFASETNTMLEVLLYIKEWDNQVIENMQSEIYKDVHWNILLMEESDIEFLEEQTLPDTAHVQCVPIYTGNNFDLFSKYVFIKLDDLINEPINRKTIFRHRALNDFFFGKLLLVPSGDVYSNINTPPIGNIKELSLKEIVYKELTGTPNWLKTRNTVSPCNNCVNKDLCPSISNYEFVIGKYNLCHIKP